MFSSQNDLNSIEQTFIKLFGTYKEWNSFSTEEKKDKIPAIIADFKNIEKLIEGIISRNELDFFNLGFYIYKNEKADLSALSFEVINKQTKKFVDETFIPTFTEYNRAALEHSIYKTLNLRLSRLKCLKM